MDIISLGHSSFKISSKTASLVTDPFDPKMLGYKFAKTSADIVTLSHNHPDHNFVEGVSDIHKVVSGPGEYEIKGISIIGYPSYHDATKGSERGSNVIYVIEVEGYRLAHLGDLGHTLDDKLVSELGDIDILMVPCGGGYTITAEEAVKVTQSIEPKIVIPMHYASAGLEKEFADKLTPVETFVTALGSVPETMKKLSLKPGSMLSEELKLIILDRA